MWVRKLHVLSEIQFYFFIFWWVRASKKENDREWYVQYRWQLCDGERKSASHWELLHRGGRWSKIERGDIANKGDIVCNADDSQEAEEPLSACDTSSLKSSPALSFSDLSRSPSAPLSFLFLQWACDGALFFPPPRSRWKGLDISLSPFSLPHLIPVWGPFLFPSLYFFTKYRKAKHSLVIMSCV